MAKDIQKKVRNTIFLYFLKHILYIHLPEQPHLYGSDFQNYSTLILYFAPTFTHKPEGLFKRTESGRGTPK